MIKCVKSSLWFLAGSCVIVGRPVEGDSNQTETLTENNQHYITQEIADILKISKSIKLLVKMKNCVFYFTEKNLNELFGQPNMRELCLWKDGQLTKVILLPVAEPRSNLRFTPLLSQGFKTTVFYKIFLCSTRMGVSCFMWYMKVIVLRIYYNF